MAATIEPQLLTESTQDYLKAIYELTQAGGGAATSSIADRLSVSPASVTNMVQKLAERQPPLVTYRKHYGVELTNEGRLAALRTVRRHRLIEQFLTHVLGYSWDEVHQEAERLEHAISPLFEERLAILLGEPRFDPHGDPIPDANLTLPDSCALPLYRAAPGQVVRVCRVRNDNPALLRYLDELGLRPGLRVRVISSQPVDYTLQVELVDYDKQVVLGQALGEAVMVEAI
ncbi:MAG: metal-dependent transcriptional regulator [Anaerolineaceae bacterium]|nr:metal-dependent transcriptional regulator [Anaerolineaceae bacterium]